MTFPTAFLPLPLADARLLVTPCLSTVNWTHRGIVLLMLASPCRQRAACRTGSRTTSMPPFNAWAAATAHSFASPRAGTTVRSRLSRRRPSKLVKLTCYVACAQPQGRGRQDVGATGTPARGGAQGRARGRSKRDLDRAPTGVCANAAHPQRRRGPLHHEPLRAHHIRRHPRTDRTFASHHHTTRAHAHTHVG